MAIETVIIKVINMKKNVYYTLLFLTFFGFYLYG